mgnify:CR=1 FL=1
MSHSYQHIIDLVEIPVVNKQASHKRFGGEIVKINTTTRVT